MTNAREVAEAILSYLDARDELRDSSCGEGNYRKQLQRDKQHRFEVLVEELSALGREPW